VSPSRVPLAARPPSARADGRPRSSTGSPGAMASRCTRPRWRAELRAGRCPPDTGHGPWRRLLDARANPPPAFAGDGPVATWTPFAARSARPSTQDGRPREQRRSRHRRRLRPRAAAPSCLLRPTLVVDGPLRASCRCSKRLARAPLTAQAAADSAPGQPASPGRVARGRRGRGAKTAPRACPRAGRTSAGIDKPACPFPAAPARSLIDGRRGCALEPPPGRARP